MDILQYHWVGYTLGLMFMPRLTFMILLSIHVPGIPIWLMVIGWVWTIKHLFHVEKKVDPTTGKITMKFLIQEK